MAQRPLDTAAVPRGPARQRVLGPLDGPHLTHFFAPSADLPWLVQDATSRLSAWDPGASSPRWKTHGRGFSLHPRGGWLLGETTDGALVVIDVRDGARVRTLAPADPAWTRAPRQAFFLDDTRVAFQTSSQVPFATTTVVDLDAPDAPPVLEASLRPRFLLGVGRDGRTAVLYGATSRAQRVEGCDLETLARRWCVDLAAEGENFGALQSVAGGVTVLERTAAGTRWALLDGVTGAVRAEATMPVKRGLWVTAAPEGGAIAHAEKVGRGFPEVWRVSLRRFDEGASRELALLDTIGLPPEMHVTARGGSVVVRVRRAEPMRHELILFDGASARAVCVWTLPEKVSHAAIAPEGDAVLLGTSDGVWAARIDGGG